MHFTLIAKSILNQPSTRLGKKAGSVNAAFTLAVTAYAVVVSFWWVISPGAWGPVCHDEHQFVASAFLVAQSGLQPYQDFAYFHMPNLVYLYAPFFLVPYSYMLARLFVGLCTLGISLTIFAAARTLFADRNDLRSYIFPAAGVVLFLHSPLSHFASSYVWNHTPSTLCALLAFLLHCQAIRGNKPFPYFFMSGVSLGMAIGIRLSFATFLVPFLIAGLIFRTGTARDKGLYAIAFAAGGVLANLPAIYFFFTAYDNFIFGNLGYAKLNTAYRQETAFYGPMTVAGKVIYGLRAAFSTPGDFLILFLTLCSLIFLGINTLRNAARPRFEVLFLVLLLPFAYAGCMAPTPIWYQYFFAPIPFLVLLFLYAFADLRISALSAWTVPLLVVAAVISFLYGSPFIRSNDMIGRLIRTESWVPIRFHNEAENIRAFIDSRKGKGMVLTISPLYAIESGLPIYKEFVTGPFAWRVSHLLPEEEAALRGLPLQSRIQELFLVENRPRAILTGREKSDKQLEIPIIEAARQHGYQPTVMQEGSVIWLPSK